MQCLKHIQNKSKNGLNELSVKSFYELIKFVVMNRNVKTDILFKLYEEHAKQTKFTKDVKTFELIISVLGLRLLRTRGIALIDSITVKNTINNYYNSL